MTLTTLHALIPKIQWFTQLGRFQATARTLAISSVDVAGEWDWLPTSHTQPDPIHGDALIRLAEETACGAQRCTEELAVAKLASVSLQTVPCPHPQLVRGASDYTQAARGSGVFAVRMAARELVVERVGFWCGIIAYYEQGHWPCGVTEDRKVVVL